MARNASFIEYKVLLVCSFTIIIVFLLFSACIYYIFSPFIYSQNLMSIVNPYNDIVVTDFNGDINVLKRACLKTYHCIGFSSTGVLKMEIEPSNKWTRVKNESLFVLGKCLL